jgi:hypothetical protein
MIAGSAASLCAYRRLSYEPLESARPLSAPRLLLVPDGLVRRLGENYLRKRQREKCLVEQSMPYGVLREIRVVAHTHLVQDVSPVGADGLDTQVHCLRDLAYRAS